MKTLIIAAITVSVMLSACDDVFEKDLSEKQVTIVAPINGVTVPQGEVTFLWRPLEGAREYRVTVVGPSFAEAAIVVADTLMRNDSVSVKTSLRLTLNAGEYQWSIKASNGGYYTAEQIYNLAVAAPPVEPDEPTEPEPES